jgi:DNA polymerase (family X)
VRTLGESEKARPSVFKAGAPAPARTRGAATVAELLSVDREYRHKSARGALVLIAPRVLNPTHTPWLPVLHTSRGVHHYTACYSNTLRAHEFARTHDWVVLYLQGDGATRYTVVTARHGTLKGRRVVRGREVECGRYYASRARVSARRGRSLALTCP